MVKLDRIDYRILDALQENGRLPITQLAAIAGVSVSPCWQRVRRLEESGVIRHYSAEIALDKLFVVQTVFAHVILSNHTRETYDTFEKRIKKTPEIVECCELAGQFDYLLKFIVTDLDRYNLLLETLLDKSVGVEKYFSYVVTRSIKDSRTPRVQDLLSRINLS
ncbi:Lrp/AsnC family transcriptional regulator [Rhizobium lentis]|uniref:Lrp/AsnC family transcriptional regulator n=1 Tax=Rhizobium lentis TaxID=1138194 RepID=UPI001C82C016|nr:Lrp/AsnC family transcriptional regulator [Rhizobium lentis]MBX5137686.1 Lrp/AsnC family transcriptional regulator [Rhizobium lentis]